MDSLFLARFFVLESRDDLDLSCKIIEHEDRGEMIGYHLFIGE